MTGLNPSRAGGFPVELEAAATTDAAVTRTGTFEGRLGRPGEGALFIRKEGEPGDDVVNSEKTLHWSLVIRRCMFFLHDLIRDDSAASKEPGRANIERCLLPVSLPPAKLAVKS
jgi:hypothetical protein